jgi:hypothetical protein
MFQSNRAFPQSIDRKHAGDGTSRYHDDVIRQDIVVARAGTHNNCLVHMGDLRNGTGYHMGSAQALSQRNQGVPGLNRAGKNLGQKGLICHVGTWIDHGDLRPVTSLQLPFQPLGRIEPRIAATHNHNSLHAGLQDGTIPSPLPDSARGWPSLCRAMSELSPGQTGISGTGKRGSPILRN